MSKSTNMDKNAANHGDRLKHALLLEVLGRTKDWPGVAYAETHAGAGRYRAGDQKEAKHIAELRRMIRKAQPAIGMPGHAYLAWLQSWWGIRPHRGAYPGSALAALRHLEKHPANVAHDIRLTEKDPDAYRRLRRALCLGKFNIKNASFHDELGWLTENDNLVLLVDPFAIVRRYSQPGKGIEDGYINHEHAKDILNRLARKDRAVVLFWWSKGRNLWTHHNDNCEFFLQWANAHHHAVCRIHQNKRNHALAILGINGGVEVTKNLPDNAAWKNSPSLEEIVFVGERQR